MVRKHGWQLPAHTFQVVAITVFCLLVIAFYAFLAPFLGGKIWEYVLIGTYTPVDLPIGNLMKLEVAMHSSFSSPSRSSIAPANSSKKDCRKQEGIAEQQERNGEDAFEFCTLCNAEGTQV
ncbi:hypothetical protein NC653_035785 [Populus alba x Populus x berolinensis]|uniref:Uncharacterized protein n=1 Tax=Populus alba x Populus x berolinensis TaxID=444605 RepID=A0AAD6LIG3_9ROSI|nr:hypothetical protein NC653_035785 [Populus alba x Populus x berolinensis]